MSEQRTQEEQDKIDITVAKRNATRARNKIIKAEEEAARDMRGGDEVNTARPQRESVGSRQDKLSMISNAHPVGDEWHKCWVEDDDKGNYESFIRAWYEPVRDPGGELITFPSGKYRMVLMKVLTKYYDADQKLLSEENSARMKSKIALGKDEYAPDEKHPSGGRQALTRDVIDPMR